MPSLMPLSLFSPRTAQNGALSPFFKTRFKPLALMAACLALGACSPVGIAVGAGASAGVAASQERGLVTAVDDTAIAADINRLWLAHDASLFLDITTSVHEARVLLTGTVKTPEERVDAVRLAWQARGVREVLNEIQVTAGSGLINYARDRQITTALRSRLLLDREIADINYSIDTVNGTVYLMGIAQNQAELSRVINHGRAVTYVRHIVSHVRLKDEVPDTPHNTGIDAGGINNGAGGADGNPSPLPGSSSHDQPRP